MASFRAVVRQPAFFVLLAGAFFTLICLPFVLLGAPVDLFSASLFRYFFGVWGATVALLIAVARLLARPPPSPRAPDDPDEGRA